MAGAGRCRRRCRASARPLPSAVAPAATAAAAEQPPTAASLTALVLHLLVSVLALLDEPRDIAAAAEACRRLGEAAAAQAAWRGAWLRWAAAGKFAPQPALAFAKQKLHRSALRFAARDSKRMYLTAEELCAGLWSVRSKIRYNDTEDGPCDAHQCFLDGTLKVVRGEASNADVAMTWRFLRRFQGRVVPYGSCIRTRVTLPCGSWYDLPTRRVTRRTSIPLHISQLGWAGRG